MNHKFRLIIFVFSFLFFVLCSCDTKDKNMVDQVQKLIVGTSADNPPYEYISEGQIIGFDIDIIHLIAKEIGYELKLENMDFYALIPSLVTNKLDLVIAGLSINLEREKIVDFSIPYTKAHPVIIYKKSLYPNFNYRNITNKKLAAQMGTTFVSIGKSLSQKYESNLLTIENLLISMKDLLNDKIDFLILEEFQAKKFIQIHSALDFYKLDENFITSFAIAMPLNSAIKEKIDNAILKLQESGTIDNLTTKWNLY